MLEEAGGGCRAACERWQGGVTLDRIPPFSACPKSTLSTLTGLFVDLKPVKVDRVDFGSDCVAPALLRPAVGRASSEEVHADG